MAAPRPNAIHHPIHFSLSSLLSYAFSPSLLILYSYFSVILFLFYKVINASILHKHIPRSNSFNSINLTWILLAISGFFFTWFSKSMISYLFQSYDDFLLRCELTGQALEPYPFCSTSENYSLFSKCHGSVLTTQFSRMDQWLRETSLFKEAWFKVVSSKQNWWWSFEVCAITTSSLGLFLRNEGKRLSIPKVFLFMVLGQLVAISVTQNLFFLALSLRPLLDGSLEQLAALKCESEDLLLGDDEETASRYPSNVSVGNIVTRKASKTSEGITVTNETKRITEHLILHLEGRFSRFCVWFFVLFGTITNLFLPESTSFLPTALIHISSLLIFVPTSTLENFNHKMIKSWNNSGLISPLIKEWVFSNIFAFIPPTLELKYSTLNYILALFNLGSKAKHTFDVARESSADSIQDLVSDFFNPFFSHPTQTSISYDTIFIAITTFLFILIDSQQRVNAGLVAKDFRLSSMRLLATTTLILLTPSFTLSLYLAFRERFFEEKLLENEKVAISKLLHSEFEKDRKRGSELEKQLQEKQARKWVVTVQREILRDERYDGNILKKRE